MKMMKMSDKTKTGPKHEVAEARRSHSSAMRARAVFHNGVVFISIAFGIHGVVY